MQRKIRCGVIGAGWWATYAHIPTLLQHPNADLVAIQTADVHDAKRIATDFHIPHAYTRTADLLAHDEIEAVIVSSSAHLHYSDAHSALSLGKHVLVEKPMTLTVAEADDLIHVAKEHGSQFLISCPWHYTSHAREARRLIQDGEVGEVRMISVLMTNPIDDLLRGKSTEPTHGTPYMHPRQGTYSDPLMAGGGQIYTQVCHAAAYLTFLTGSRPTEVFARFHDDGEVLDIYDVLNLRMDNGAIVSVASTGATSPVRRDFEVRIFGTSGMIFLDLWHGTLEFVPLQGPPRLCLPLAEADVYPHQAPAQNLIDSILDPMRNQAPAALGVSAMEVIEAACRSAGTGRNVPVSELPRGRR